MTRRNLIQALGASLSGLIGGCRGFVIPVKTQDGVGSGKDPFIGRLSHGPLDDMLTEELYARKQVAGLMKTAFPGYGTCYRCDFPWAVVKGHATDFSRGGGGFPLCTDCWEDLQTAEYRLPYYRKMYESWEASGGGRYTWEQMEAGVRAEGSERLRWRRLR